MNTNMNSNLLHGLMKCETDIDGALSRFSGDEGLYIQCLTSFLSDKTMSELEDAIERQSWDDVFTAAHAIKGMAGNMGFIPLFHAAAELVIVVRTGKTSEVKSSFISLRRCYSDIVKVVKENCQG